jgi:polyribonucleotide nucleotidyltransferase
VKEEVKVDIGSEQILFESGELARQADGAVLCKVGDSVVLTTCVMAEEAEEEGIDFVPLTVEYREKSYAAGKIPGGFIKREGKPGEKEVLTSRLIDRGIRPLLPDSLTREIQVISWVLSADEAEPDVIAINSASAALYISHLPFETPIGAVRVGYKDGKFFVGSSFPNEWSELNIVVAGTEDAITMVEGGGNEVKEEIFVQALEFAHPYIKEIIRGIKILRERIGKEKVQIPMNSELEGIRGSLVEYKDDIESALKVKEKKKRRELLNRIYDESLMKWKDRMKDEALLRNAKSIFLKFFKELEKDILRRWIKENGLRIDGRGLDDLREIRCAVSVLPRTHGSAIFQRGETMALVVTTLGTKEDEQIIEALGGDFSKRFMLHYNFPPFSVGEVRPIRGPGRREIGHGALAERAFLSLIPDKEAFPYTIRVVSDILESNGSSSMATVCGASLSMMDAGVPLKKAVGGVAMGLVKEDDRFFILTDILGDEDHLGDMDFKIAGTRDGITSVQMDIKIKGVTPEIMRTAIDKARIARMKILDIMDSAISEPRKELSPYAPRVLKLQINPERIKDLIGPGGKNIKSIIEETGVKIDVENDGRVLVFSADSKNAERARELIMYFTGEVEIGKVYTGKVKRIADFGAFVEIFPGVEGLIHISQLDYRRVKKVTDVVKVGDEVQVKVIGINEDGKIQLSRKEALKEGNQYERKKKD